MIEITLPGSKSITNRNLILSSLANGKSILKNILRSDDTDYMIEALKKLGIKIEYQNEDIIIHGGIENIKGNDQTLFLGDSGTAVRFLIGLSILNQSGSITITGTNRMKERPIRDLINGILQLGIRIKSNYGYLPVTIGDSIFDSYKTKQKPAIIILGFTSSQYLTSLLQIAPLLPLGCIIKLQGKLVSKPYIDMTINEMKKFGVEIDNDNYNIFDVNPQKYLSQETNIEGDASSLSYFAAFVLLNGGEITINNIGSDTKQGDYLFLDICKNFGLEYSSTQTTTTLRSKGLKNIKKEFIKKNYNFEDMPNVSVTFMILAIFLPGKTHIDGLQILNLKVSKRIEVMKEQIQKLGVEVESTDNSIIIGDYQEDKKNNQIIEIETYNDHRVAMSFGILNSFIGGLKILNPECVKKTYPNFWKDLEKLEKHFFS